MQKYLALARVNLAQYLVYRLSFILRRVRVVLSLLLTYFLWTTVFTQRLKAFSYSESAMLTYIVLIYLLGEIVYSSRIADLAGQIRSGEVINYLLKPYSFFRVMFTRELVDKLLNLFFSLLEVALLIGIFKPEIIIKSDFLTLSLALGALFLGVIISFFISFTISLIAFWSTEVWAPRFVFTVLITVMAGSYFPLDIFPKVFYQLLLLTPFPYFAYLPTKILLEGFSLQYLAFSGVALVWVLLSYFLAKGLWRKGMREFSFFGR